MVERIKKLRSSKKALVIALIAMFIVVPVVIAESHFVHDTDVEIQGELGIGTTPSALLDISGSGSQANMAWIDYTYTGTGNPVGLRAIPNTSGNANTLTSIMSDPGIGASTTVGYVYDLYLSNPNKGGGATITNAYGIYIENIDSGTNNWSIYTGSGPSHFGGDVDVSGDLTVDGTIYGELAENLVLEPPAGFSVAIAQGRALEANYLKALSGDSVTLDDDFIVIGDLYVGGDQEFQGEQTISTTAGDLILAPFEDVALGSGVEIISVAASNSNIVLNPDGTGVVQIGVEGSPTILDLTYASKVEGGAGLELEATTIYLDALSVNVANLAADADMYFDAGVGGFFKWEVNNTQELYLDSNSLDIAAGSDLNIGANYVMDDTGITDSSGNWKLDTDGVVQIEAGASDEIIFIVDSAGVGYFDDAGDDYLYVYGDVNAVGYNTHGDRSHAQNVSSAESLLDKLNKIDVVRYEHVGFLGQERIGIIAQDLAKIFPELVSCSADLFSGQEICSTSSDLWMVTIKAVQELADQVDALGNIAALEARVTALEAKASDLAKQVADLQSGMSDLEARVAALEALLVAPAEVEVEPTPEVTPEPTVESGE